MLAKLVIPILLGISGLMLWLSWSWFPLASCLQIIAGLLLLKDLWDEGKRFVLSAPSLVSCGFIFLMVLYAIPVFLPETGFDALWYHLPITEVFAHSHVVRYIPELYQSAMPRLGSFMFVPAYTLAGVMGVKIMTFFITLTGISWVYVCARTWFRPARATFLVLCVYAFHVFGWQSSSAYVDQVRFMFEIAALWIFLKKSRTRVLFPIGAVLVGFALSTKLVALFFFPAILLWLCIEYGWILAWRVLCIALCVVAPWYLQAYRWTGNPLYPLFQNIDGKELLAVAGITSVWKWAIIQLVKLPFLPFVLAINKESYTSPLFVLGYASLIGRKILYKPLYVFVLIVGLILLFILPFSFRYAWAAMILLFLLLMKQYCEVYAKNRVALIVLYVVGCCGIVFQIIMRTGVIYNALPLLMGNTSEQTYVQAIETPLSHGPFSLWYGGYWHTYTPSSSAQ